MGVFEDVFTKRAGVEDSGVEDSVTGAFEEVFVRRGRWRKAGTSNPGHDDVVDLAEHVVFDLAEMTDSADPMLQESNDPAISDIVDATQFVVKNTFINPVHDYDSLKEFMWERKVQSCPASSIIIDDIACIGDIGIQAEPSSMDVKDGAFNTASSHGDVDVHLAVFRANSAVYNTASTFMDGEFDSFLQRISEVAPVPSNSAVCIDNASAFGTEKIDDTMLAHRQLGAEERLRNLRMKGSAIQQKLTDTINAGVQQDLAIQVAFQLGQQSALQWVAAPHIPNVDASLLEVSMLPPPPPGAAPVATAVLRLAEAIAPPELGGLALPSMGSMLHHKGECKPCTFFHTRGCENKEDCQFCHLCGPGEKKKRLKQLKAVQREATFAALENAKATLSSWSAAEGNMDADMIIE